MSGRINEAVKLRLPPVVKAQLETLAAERGSTVSDTVAALVALAWGDSGPVALPPAEARKALAEARREAKGRRPERPAT